MDVVFPEVPLELRAKRLAVPSGPVRAIFDSDVANEIDDPFAIVHALRSPEAITLDGLCIAPFRREGLTAGDSLKLSRDLAEETLGHLGVELPLHDGSAAFMDDAKGPIESPAVEAILEASHDTQDPLVIMAIGACTNVASALLIDPELALRATVWWLAGHTPDLHAWEYNLVGDKAASKVLLDSGIPIVQFPAMGVTSHLLTSLPAMEAELEETGELGRFLTRLLREHIADHYGTEKELWDVAVPAWAINPEWQWSTLEPGLSFDPETMAWTRKASAPLWRRITWCSRNAILKDLWQKIAQTSS